MRHTGGHNRFDVDPDQLSTQSNRFVSQLGSDIARWDTDSSGLGHLGMMAGYASSRSRTHSSLTGYTSRGRISGYSVGLYGTWFADARYKTGGYTDTWLLYNWFHNTISGEGLVAEEYNSDGITASVETGYSFLLGESGNKHSCYWLQPKAQIIWMDVQADNHTEKNGTRTEDNTGGNLQTRLGVKAFLQGNSKTDDGKEHIFQPFVEINWIYAPHSYRVKMDDVSYGIKGMRNTGELKLGVEGQLEKKLQLWGNVAQQLGDSGFSDTRGMLGIKYSF